MNQLLLKNLPLSGKKVLVRVDFNVPFANNTIGDDSRIQAALPTIQYILDHQGTVILMSHLGRPKGKKDPGFSLAPCAKRLSELLKKDVLMAPDCIGEEVEKMARGLTTGDILLLENLRFYDAEEHPDHDPEFAEKLAKLGDLYVNDAFGTAHRNHSSTATITQYFPSKAAAGFLMEKEIVFLSTILQNPKAPFFTILGGAKVDTKVGMIENILDKIDALFIGGAMSYTFLRAKGIPMGSSPIDELQTAKKILNQCKKKKVPLYLPEDIVIADSFKDTANTKIIDAKLGFSSPWQGMDIGPKTVASWEKKLKPAATIFWNGPVGVFEMPSFAKGTKAIATFLASLPATTIVGGGDSVAAITQLGLTNKFSHISTGGGASLEFLEQGTLPGIEALSLAN